MVGKFYESRGDNVINGLLLKLFSVWMLRPVFNVILSFIFGTFQVYIDSLFVIAIDWGISHEKVLTYCLLSSFAFI